MSGSELAAVQGGNNASEFVRKLFRMLEDPSHQDVARWGKDGDTFVVVEGEKFTRSILPKHFKHSNMSSFIRQLNKYDFHKVKVANDGENSSPNGNVLEFKHPYFRVDSKDDLDNIRRKAPAPRKPQVTEDFTTSQHITVISEQLTATQQQVQQLQELFADVSQTNRLLVNEVLTLQKMLNAQKQAQHEMLNYLTPYPDNSHNGHTHNHGHGHAHSNSNSNPVMAQSISSNSAVSVGEAEEPVPELRRARELLSSVSTDSVADRELERLHGVYGSPAESGAMVTPSSMPMMHDPMTDIGRYPVYPVGQTVGIDPFHSDHINKIPYAMPSDANSGLSEPPQQQPQAALAHPPTPSTPLEKSGSMWGQKKPRVFLVEDDAICTKIGVKFLKSMGCDVEHASNGADAYSRISDLSREQFDLIFMDIIMPKLDGVSATLYIRQHYPSVPIVAMTSNIRPDEVNGYFEHGMNGVLAKPFTKEGMLKSVKTHLHHLLKNTQAQDHSGSAGGYFVGAGSYLSTSGIGSSSTLKYENTTPPAGATWSPGLPQTSSMTSGVDQGYLMTNGSSYNMTPGGSRPAYPKMESPSGRMSDHDSPPGKRQRLNVTHAYS